jgi:hypothetical protein
MFVLLFAVAAVGVHAAAAQSLDGVWKSDGYGNVYELNGNTMKAFEATTQTCVPAFTAARVAPPASGQDEVFRVNERDRIAISAGERSDDKLLNHSIHIRRLARLPEVCSAPTANTTLGNFEVFTRTFAEQYIAFGLRHVDWDRVVTANREKVTARTSPRELFEILDSMIRPLGDLHTGIEAPRLKLESKESLRAITDRAIKGRIEVFATKGRRALFAVTDGAWSHGPIRSFCRGQVQFAIFQRQHGLSEIPVVRRLCAA